MGLPPLPNTDLSSDTHADTDAHFLMSLNVSASPLSQSETQERDVVPDPPAGE